MPDKEYPVAKTASDFSFNNVFVCAIPFDLIKSSAVQLDKHYLGARYPSVLPAGVPFESYSSEDGDRALVIAQDTYDFVVEQLNLFMNDG